MTSLAVRGLYACVMASALCACGSPAQPTDEPDARDRPQDDEAEDAGVTPPLDVAPKPLDGAAPPPFEPKDAASPPPLDTRNDAALVTGKRSAGCGVAGASGIVAGQVLGHGFVDVFPAAYDNQRAYPLLLIFHSGNGQEYEPLGLPNNGSRRNLDLGFTHALGDETIAASVAGTEGNYNIRAGSPDLAAVDAHLKDLLATRCVDLSRIYAVGRGAGGKMATAAACALRVWVRAFARIGSPDLSAIAACDAPIAGFAQAALTSGEVDPERNASIATAIRENNGCNATAAMWPATDAACSMYANGCSAEPFLNCITTGRIGDEDPNASQTVERVWRFFSALPPR